MGALKILDNYPKIGILAGLPFQLGATIGSPWIVDYASKQFNQEQYFSGILAITGMVSSLMIPTAIFVAAFGLLRRKTIPDDVKKTIQNIKNNVPETKISHLEEIIIKPTAKDIAYQTIVGTGSSVRDRKKYAVYGRQNKSPNYLFDAAYGYFENQEYDEGIICIRDALAMLKGKSPKLSPIYRFDYWSKTIGANLNQFFNPADINAYLLKAGYSAVHDQQTSIKNAFIAKELAKKTRPEKSAEAHLLYALLAHAFNLPEKDRAFRETFHEMKSEPQQRLGESRNLVYTLGNQKHISQTFVFKNSTDKTELELEAETSLKLAELLGDRATTPEPLAIINQENGTYTYVMRYVPGKTLDELTATEQEAILPLAASLIAYIGARYPSENLKQINLDEKLAKKIKDTTLHLPEDISNQLLANFTPIHLPLISAPQGVNQDSHKQNLQFNANLGVLDTSYKEKHPLILDLANLVAYNDISTPEQKHELADKYAKTLQLEGISMLNMSLASAYKEHTFLMRSFHNSTIHRMLCLLTAWSDPERKKLHPKRVSLVNTALDAINLLSKDDEPYFKQEKHHYEQLRNALERTRNFLSYTS